MPNVVFLTGSGLSADSGLRTFRGRDGIYAGMRAEKVMSAGMLRANPSLVHELSDDMRESFGRAVPNAAHGMVARVAAAAGDKVTVLTQNIDDLLERAGTPGVVHLHGLGTRLRAVGNSRFTADIGHARYWSGPPEAAPPGGYQFRCPVTNSRYRPDVVLFDEDSPHYPRMRKAIGALGRDDLLVVIGTQLDILPVAEAVRGARCRSILNNLHPGGADGIRAFDEVIHERASEAAARIEEACMAVLGTAPAPAP